MSRSVSFKKCQAVLVVALFACYPLVSQAKLTINVFDVSQYVGAARSNTSSHAYHNILKPELTFLTEPEGSIAFTSSFGKHKIIFKVMAVIDKMIRNGDGVPWDDFPAAPPLGLGGMLKFQLPMTYKKWFKIFKVGFQYLFYTDSCATFWNEQERQWFSCCEVTAYDGDNGAHEKVGFCGSNIAFDLPNPCRRPEQKFDYGLQGSAIVYPPAQQTTANHFQWNCPLSVATIQPGTPTTATTTTEVTTTATTAAATPTAATTATATTVEATTTTEAITAATTTTETTTGATKTAAPTIQVRHGRNRKSSKAGKDNQGSKKWTRYDLQENTAARMFEDFIIIGDPSTGETFTVDLAPEVQIDNNLCGKDMTGVHIPSCFSLCCDSIYAMTEFCRAKKSCV